MIQISRLASLARNDSGEVARNGSGEVARNDSGEVVRNDNQTLEMTTIAIRFRLQSCGL